MAATASGPSESAMEAATAFASESGTAQLAIIRSGTVVAESAVDPSPVDVFAVQKGLVSVMFGMATDRGLLRLDDPVSTYLGRGWTQLPPTTEQRLTIETVLHMTTGMDDELAPLGEVGVTWRYNNVAYNYLKTVLEQVTERSMNELTSEWLLEPLGMASTRWIDRQVVRPDGRAITGLESTAEDLAQFGAMVLDGGRGLISASHIDRLGCPGSEENPSWGLSWWNNDQPHYRLPRSASETHSGPIIPSAPSDTLAARGALDSFVCVVPSLDLVVARTALFPTDGRRPAPMERQFWSLLMNDPT